MATDFDGLQARVDAKVEAARGVLDDEALDRIGASIMDVLKIVEQRASYLPDRCRWSRCESTMISRGLCAEHRYWPPSRAVQRAVDRL